LDKINILNFECQGSRGLQKQKLKENTSNLDGHQNQEQA
jgi:hypothetical protein